MDNLEFVKKHTMNHESCIPINFARMMNLQSKDKQEPLWLQSKRKWDRKLKQAESHIGLTALDNLISIF